MRCFRSRRALANTAVFLIIVVTLGGRTLAGDLDHQGSLRSLWGSSRVHREGDTFFLDDPPGGHKPPVVDHTLAGGPPPPALTQSGRQDHSSPTADLNKAIITDNGKPEQVSISAINRPFLESPDDWTGAYNGIYLTVTGEPKSGTTWLARVVVKLSLRLCGSPNNQWCQMGGVVVTPNKPAPMYEFEMLNAANQTAFLHFRGRFKHEVFWVSRKEGGCGRGHLHHPNGFGDSFPCQTPPATTRTRKLLLGCLPSTTPRCLQLLPPIQPARRRMVVIVRDPRNVVVSERRFRVEAYHQKHVKLLNDFVHQRFEIICAWIHQRWVWHTTTLGKISHVVIYEDLQENYVHLVAMAKFLGLDCVEEQALQIWNEHRPVGAPAHFANHGLPLGTLDWMNFTMSKLLPEPLLHRWGLSPILL